MPTDGMGSVAVDGVLNLNKPAGITSAAAVGRIKRLLPRGTKVGHAGTLDPFATGVLLLLIGRATKSCERIMDLPKQYDGTVKFGATTETDDPEAAELLHAGAREVAAPAVDAALRGFVGIIRQTPPVFSAIKIGGVPAYRRVRAGETLVLAARDVHVYGITRLAYAWPELRLRIDCGRGTYIRAIARDLGQVLGVGGYLVQLCRTRVGPFHLDCASPLTGLSAESLPGAVTPMDELDLEPKT